MQVHFPVRRWSLCVFFVVVFLTQSLFAQVEVSRLRTDLAWQRTSPAKGETEGPVLYALIMRSSATPGSIPKISSNYTLTNSLITDNGTIVAIGGFSVDSTGLVTFKSGQTFPGAGNGTVTSVSAASPLSVINATSTPNITLSGLVNVANGGTGIGSSGASGNFLRSNGGAWASAPIQAGDLPGLSGTYVDLSTTQVIGGNKTFSNLIAGSISGNAATANTATTANNALALGGNAASAYSTTAQSDARYLQLSGGTLTGGLNGTSASFSGAGDFAGDLTVGSAGGNIIFKNAIAVPISNNNTGTTLNELAELTPVGGSLTVNTAGTSNNVGAIGVVVAGAGTTGAPVQATVAITGAVTCSFDGPATAGDYVVKSTTTGGMCSDGGASYPAGLQTLGRVITTTGACSPPNCNTLIALYPGEQRSNTGTVTGITGGTGLTGGTITGSGTLALDTAFTDGRYLKLSGGTLTGTVTFAGGQAFSGDGSGLTNLNAGNLASGTVAAARLPLATSSDTTAGLVVQANDTRLTNSRTPSAGSSFYIQNGTSAQAASMNITGTATVGSTVTAGNLVSTQLSSSTGQALTVNAGDGSGSGGALTVRGGSAGIGSGGAGGNLTLQAGNAMSIGGSGYGGLGAAGMVSIKAGDGYNNVGGDVSIVSGANGPWTLAANSFSKVFIQGGTINPGDGAVIKVEGGHNTVYGSPPQYSAGGNLSFTAGSGTCSGGGCATNANQPGGNVSIAAGNGGAGSIGGSITLTPGTGTSNGNVQVVGNLSVTGTVSKGAGSFKIDDPLDPANKYLSHSFVESPDMMNIYNGNVLLDSKGEAWVVLPEYFEALNQDFRYQLTAIGAPGPGLYVAQEIKDNHFQIAGGKPGAKVSWQVTGIRHDAYANAHRIPNEEDKVGDDRGSYLNPELFHQTEAKRIVIPHQMSNEKTVISAQSAR
jgi:hypothetical protein